MKKILLLALCAICLSSCFCDKIAVGNIDYNVDLVHVKSTRNAHILFGAIVTHERTADYVPFIENYVVETKMTFWDMFVGGLTLGIYQPTTTKYYVPINDPNVVSDKKKFMSSAHKGRLK